MAILNGTYYFNTVVSSSLGGTFYFDFINKNGKKYNGIKAESVEEGNPYDGFYTSYHISFFYRVPDPLEDYLTFYDLVYDDGWLYEYSKIITIDNQTVEEVLYNWITSNATNIDKMLISYSTVKDIADTLRIATGTTGGISVGDFADKIASLHLITGKWVLSDPIPPEDPNDASFEFNETVNFTSNGASFTSIRSWWWTVGTENEMLYDSIKVFYYETQVDEYGWNVYHPKWANEAYKTIDFGTTPQIISEYFYNWLITNATHISEG